MDAGSDADHDRAVREDHDDPRTWGDETHEPDTDELIQAVKALMAHPGMSGGVFLDERRRVAAALLDHGVNPAPTWPEPRA